MARSRPWCGRRRSAAARARPTLPPQPRVRPPGEARCGAAAPRAARATVRRAAVPSSPRRTSRIRRHAHALRRSPARPSAACRAAAPRRTPATSSQSRSCALRLRQRLPGAFQQVAHLAPRALHRRLDHRRSRDRSRERAHRRVRRPRSSKSSDSGRCCRPCPHIPSTAGRGPAARSPSGPSLQRYRACSRAC